MSKDHQEIKDEIEKLQKKLTSLENNSNESYYFSSSSISKDQKKHEIPKFGQNAKNVKLMIEDTHTLDFNQKLNTSSYVNVSFEEEEEKIAIMGLGVNLADQTVYPHSYGMHDKVVNMIAQLWNCPTPNDFDDYGVFAGAGTVGSTEGCLLAGLALKFRWRKWYANKHNISLDKTLGIRPNLIISSCFQAAWEKLFKYMDIEPIIISPSIGTFTLDPSKVIKSINDKTIGVVCILGNHYGGHYDPVWDINATIDKINQEKDYQVGIHVDAASGGFIAPFQKDLPPWDFRLKNVLSISASGHKYGESCAGTGWIVWRERKNLSEHVATSVTYLGGNAESHTLNFSRPASGVYVQYYKLLRLGLSGYQQCCNNLMENAKFIRDHLKSMKSNGKNRFIFLDNGEEHCLPVVTAMLNPDCNFTYDDIDLQHSLAQHHWYVSGYKMGFNHPLTEEYMPIFLDRNADQTMFRIVVKNNLTREMAESLIQAFLASFEFLDSVDFSKLHKFETQKLRHKNQKISNHC